MSSPEGHGLAIVLVEPEIPPNTGSVARLCAATGTPLHLVEPLGFSLDDRHLKRAGLDYWPSVDLHLHADWKSFVERVAPRRLLAFSAGAATNLFGSDAFVGEDDAHLVFGKESAGLASAILDDPRVERLTIPIDRRHVRSLNLANAVSVALYEGLRVREWTPPRSSPPSDA